MFASLSLRYDGQTLSLLDQTRLPDEERWIDATSPAAMIEAIHTLRVRGAPLIGVAAALCLGLRARAGADVPELRAVAAALRAARPTAVNLMWAIDHLLAVIELNGDVTAAAEQIFVDDVALCDRMADHGAALVEDGEGILTHCNTGALATAGVGTALGVIRRAWESGKRVHVWVDETRPLLQGARLTAWELGRLGIPHTLITDSMAALVLRDGGARRVLVGADRIARNGDFANKVGTYGLAVLARAHDAAFHVVAPWSTVDLDCPDGAAIPIELRAAAEVRGVAGSFGAVRWAPEGTPVYNPAFDVTPARLVTSLVLDTGVVRGALSGTGTV
jgi:methylthioribose-1-phosphate isomerase